jgi:hypothetical protein
LANQMRLSNLEESVDQREAGLERVAQNAGDWLSWIRLRARLISAKNGYVSASELRQVADYFNRQPHHPNAWGAVFRGKNWKLVGYKRNAQVSAHARRVGMWKWVGE